MSRFQMSKELDELMGKINIPPLATQKDKKVGYYKDTPHGRKQEAHRLFKSMKVGLLTEEDLTDHGIKMLKDHYPFMRK